MTFPAGRREPPPEFIPNECENVIAFVQKLQEIYPAIPDPVINTLLAEGGAAVTDQRVSRIFNIAAQKFITDILGELQSEGKVNVQLWDLKPILAARGVHVHRPEFLISGLEEVERPAPFQETDLFDDGGFGF
jgi:hypothetical protein